MALLPAVLVRPLIPFTLPLQPLVKLGVVPESTIDYFTRLIHPAWRMSRIMARVCHKSMASDDCISLTLAPNHNWQGFQPGQHIQLWVEINGIRHSRSYSLSSPLRRNGQLEITVRLKAGGKVSNWLAEQVQVGDWLEIGQPFGEFALPENPRDPLLMISAGSGITPMLGMLRERLRQHPEADISLVHYARSRRTIPFLDELIDLQNRHPNFQVRFSLTGEPSPRGWLTGRFQAEHLEGIHDIAARRTYVCGSWGFTDTVRTHLRNQYANLRLQVEAFTPPQAPADQQQPLDVAFRLSGKTFKALSGKTLLESAEAAGLKPAYGCRMGICNTCTCTKVKGAVKDLRTGEIHHEPNEHIRLCITAPVTELEIDL